MKWSQNTWALTLFRKSLRKSISNSLVNVPKNMDMSLILSNIILFQTAREIKKSSWESFKILRASLFSIVTLTSLLSKYSKMRFSMVLYKMLAKMPSLSTVDQSIASFRTKETDLMITRMTAL